jgi:hypothetical protein
VAIQCPHSAENCLVEKTGGRWILKAACMVVVIGAQDQWHNDGHVKVET